MIAALFILKSLAVGAVTLLLIFALRKNSAATRHRTCMIGLLALVALPFASISGWQMPLRVPESTGAIAKVAKPFTAVVPQGSATAELPAPARPIFLPAPDVQPKTSLPLWPLWLIGAIICSIRPLAGALQARLLIRNAEPASPDLLALANNCAFEQKVSGTLRVLTSNEVESALAWGHLRPVVMLPSSASSWSEDDLRTIFLHEFAHIARGDWLAQAFASAVCSLYWFNPFAWAISARLRKEAERAADDLVLRCGVPPEAYATCLIQIARQLRRRPRPAGVAPILDPTQIENRIRGIMSKKINRGGITPLRSVAIATVVALATLPLAAVFPYRFAAQDTGTKRLLPPEPEPPNADRRVSTEKPKVGAPMEHHRAATSATPTTTPMELPNRIEARATPDEPVVPEPQEVRWSPILPEGAKVALHPYVVDLAGIAERHRYNLRYIRDSYTVVAPNFEKPIVTRIDISQWPMLDPSRGHADGGCTGTVGYDGFVVLPNGQKSVDWDRLEVKVVNSEYVALVVPKALNEDLVDEAVASLKSSLAETGIATPVKVFRDNGRGYIFLPGNKDYLGEQQAFLTAYSEQHRNQKPPVPAPVQGLRTDLPPSNFFPIEADNGYIWISPNTVESRGKRHLITKAVTGYPQMVQSTEPNMAPGGRNGGTLAFAREEGIFIHQSGVLLTNYSRAETILLNGEFTLLVVPEDVSEEDIQRTITELYSVNNTNAEQSPIKVVRQRREGLIVFPGPKDELMQANARAKKG